MVADGTQAVGTAIEVTLKAQDTEAWIVIRPARPVHPELIRKALREKNVVEGILEDALVAAAQRPRGDAMKVAQSKPPVHGHDAVWRFGFECRPENKPLELDDGSVDLREVSSYSVVNQGQVLATKTERTRGVSGRSVTGRALVGEDGRDVVMRAGPNAELSADGATIVALATGQPLLEGNRVSVRLVLEIKGDVDFSTGNICFPGSVKIIGSVNTGFSVAAGRDVEIWGQVEGGTVEALGNVSIREGVRSRSRIAASGNVSLRFIDSDSFVYAGANIGVSDSVIDSHLHAALAVKIGRKLIGGSVVAGDYVSTNSCGSPRGNPTRIDFRRTELSWMLDSLKQELEDLHWVLFSAPAEAQLGRTGAIKIAYRAPAHPGSNPPSRPVPSGPVSSRPSLSRSPLPSRGGSVRPSAHPRSVAHPSSPPKRPGVIVTTNVGDSLKPKSTIAADVPLVLGVLQPTEANPFVASRLGFQPGVEIWFQTKHFSPVQFEPTQRISEIGGQIIFGVPKGASKV
jgi:hypothetical protein